MAPPQPCGGLINRIKGASMDFRRVLITGGAGFVGANLAVNFKRHFPNVAVTSFDNLSRRGSELNLPRLKRHGVSFVHGDVRCPEDVADWAPFDLLIDCSAQPSVHAGLNGSPMPVIQNNLQGTIYCAEAARRHKAAVVFLSTSRVYPIAAVNGLPFCEEATRLRWTSAPHTHGFSEHGIAEDYPLSGARSLYGATKLASELILQEYAFSYEMPLLINRCGILTGPWQMGKVDQGVITFWVAAHLLGKRLRYTGFGGKGKQVRDLLHVDDLFALLCRQLDQASRWDGRIYNVGGGQAVSTSLAELTEACQQATGHTITIDESPETAAVDVRIYITDARRAMEDFGWKPRHDVTTILDEITAWFRQEWALLEPIFQ
jgi:CDP-paratose 2-epimerase